MLKLKEKQLDVFGRVLTKGDIVSYTTQTRNSRVRLAIFIESFAETERNSEKIVLRMIKSKWNKKSSQHDYAIGKTAIFSNTLVKTAPFSSKEILLNKPKNTKDILMIMKESKKIKSELDSNK